MLLDLLKWWFVVWNIAVSVCKSLQSEWTCNQHTQFIISYRSWFFPLVVFIQANSPRCQQEGCCHLWPTPQFLPDDPLPPSMCRHLQAASPVSAAQAVRQHPFSRKLMMMRKRGGTGVVHVSWSCRETLGLVLEPLPQTGASFVSNYTSVHCLLLAL